MLDLIIIGAGPAGITASVYASRKKMSFMVISRDIGGQTAWSGDIENYTGYQFITGPDLVAKFEEHMKTYGVAVRDTEEVTGIEKAGEVVRVRTNKGAYEARALIIASGKKSRELDVPGEKEYKNKGLTYCATCDAPLFAGKDVAVIGGGNSALDAALQLMRIAKHIYLINIGPKFTGDAVMQEKVTRSELVTVMNNVHVKAILGDKFVNGLRIKHEGRESTLPVQGIFTEIGLLPNSQFAEKIEKNQRGEIKINSRNETNIPGIFAAGDVTDVPEKQIIIAAGEGSKAALRVFRYLNQKR